MTNLEYIIFCLMIPVAYVITYIAGEKQVIETFLELYAEKLEEYCRRIEGEKTMQEYYNENADFKAYVDKYARDYKLSVEEALESALVRQAYEYYKEEQEKEHDGE